MKLITKIIFIFFFVLTNFTSASENYFSEGKEFTIDYELKEAARKHNLDGKITLTKASNEGIQIIK